MHVSSLRSLRDELMKISAPMPQFIGGTSLLHGAAMPPRAAQVASALPKPAMAAPAAAPPARRFTEWFKKEGAMGTTPMLPGVSAAAGALGAHAFPKPARVPSMSNVNPWDVKMMSPGANASSMTAATVPPARWRGAPAPSMVPKLAADLTAEQRDKLPPKDFAVKPGKSNTGKEAYPIPDRQHASSALGFAKMHGDSADLASVRAKVKAKFPDMLKKAGLDFEYFYPGTEGYHSQRFREALLQLPQRLFYDEKTAAVMDAMRGAMTGDVGKHLVELGGLGILAVPSVDELQAHARAGLAGDYNKAGVKKREFLPSVAAPVAEAAGLGTLMAPEAASLGHHLLGKLRGAGEGLVA